MGHHLYISFLHCVAMLQRWTYQHPGLPHKGAARLTLRPLLSPVGLYLLPLFTSECYRPNGSSYVLLYCCGFDFTVVLRYSSCCRWCFYRRRLQHQATPRSRGRSNRWTVLSSLRTLSQLAILHVEMVQLPRLGACEATGAPDGERVRHPALRRLRLQLRYCLPFLTSLLLQMDASHLSYFSFGLSIVPLLFLLPFDVTFACGLVLHLALRLTGSFAARRPRVLVGECRAAVRGLATPNVANGFCADLSRVLAWAGES